MVDEGVSKSAKPSTQGFHIINIKASPEQMRGYFSFLEEKSKNHPGFCIRFGKHVLKLTFPTKEYVRMYEKTLQIVKTEMTESPDGTIHIWNGKIEEHLPMRGNVYGDQWNYDGTEGKILAWRYCRRLTVHDYRTNSQYIVMEGPLESYTPPWHPFRFEFHNFAERNGYVLLHSAAVGLGNQGVLISATGGRGKSTTVLGCLSEGFSYVSDDYLIMDRREGVVYPLYSCGILNEDSLERLPELKAQISDWVPNRENRAVLDLNTYSSQFVQGMKVKAMICPSIPKKPEEMTRKPQICPDEMQAGKMQMAVSTARQNGTELLKDSKFIYGVMECVKDLPSYEFLLNSNRKENTEVLKSFLETMK